MSFDNGILVVDGAPDTWGAAYGNGWRYEVVSGSMTAALEAVSALGYRVRRMGPPGAIAELEAERDPEVAAAELADAWLDTPPGLRDDFGTLTKVVRRHVLEVARVVGHVTIPGNASHNPPGQGNGQGNGQGAARPKKL